MICRKQLHLYPGSGPCKPCKRAACAAYYRKNVGIILPRILAREQTTEGRIRKADYVSRRREIPRVRIRQLALGARRRANQKNLKFSDVIIDSFSANPPMMCACCRRKLDYSMRRGRNCGASPSFDRVDNSSGYIVSNVQVICWRCNSIKKDATLTELKGLVRYMQEYTQ